MSANRLKKETRELMRVQAGLDSLLEQIAKRINQKPVRPSMSLRDIYLNQFVNINEQQIRGIYNDRQRNFRKLQRSKTAR